VSCYHPMPARQGEGERVVFLKARDRDCDSTGRPDFLELPCGRCIGCRMDRARSWSIRIMHEAQFFDRNIFVTLDYAPEHLPGSLSLEYRDFQLFMKRLRKEVPGVSRCPSGKKVVRFFVSGEYGEQFQRPHWHAILFNCFPRDMERYCNGTSRSSQLESIWGKGNVVIGDVTPRSAGYCAGYSLSKQSRRLYEDSVVSTVTGEVSSRRPPFAKMSRRPGLGFWWYQRFASDLFTADHAVVDGKKWKVPQFYWRKYQEDASAFDVARVAAIRDERARAVPVEEGSERRRSDREVVAWARLKARSH